MSTDELDNLKLTLDKIKEFIDVLMEVTLCSDVGELKDHLIIDSVWNEVEKKLNINKNLLKYLWNYSLHLQLFCPEPIYMNDINIKLIEYFQKQGVPDETQINWNKVGLYFDGITTHFLRRTFHALTKRVKSTTKIKDMKEMIGYLHDTYIPNIISDDDDKVLLRLKYNEHSLSYIDTYTEAQVE